MAKTKTETKFVTEKRVAPEANVGLTWTVTRKYPRDPNGDLGQDPSTLRPEGSQLILVTPKEFEELADGTKLFDIFGFPAVKGKDVIDQDTRNGYLAYGLVKE
jgi:hypothetical protein